MNTSLKFTALILAAAVPAVFAAESFGFVVPTLLDSTHLLSAFVAVLTVLTMLADYRAPGIGRSKSLAAVPRSQYRLAA